MNIVDTSGWLEYLADSPLAGNYAAAIENTDELLVPSIVLYEVFKKITLAFDENKAFAAIAQLKQGQLVDVDEAVALYAAGPADFADCLLAVKAVQAGCEALRSFDKKMRGLPGMFAPMYQDAACG